MRGHRCHISITDGLAHCWGCGKTVGVHELVLRDSDSGEVIACRECKERII